MYTLLIIFHVIFCVFLILVILLQTGKGSGMGAAFGGGSQTVFGPRGSGSFMGKLTAAIAALFMVSSLVLAYLSSSGTSGIEKKLGALAEQKAKEVQEVDVGKPAAPVAPVVKPDAGPTAPATRPDAGPTAAAPVPAPSAAPAPADTEAKQ
ncbi:MAG: preprotein translocase subunit SecG [Deltaproteobacteria bacterium]|nr:preprotein translocase subunit SecG [Deltaproteobacteria bacterium]